MKNTSIPVIVNLFLDSDVKLQFDSLVSEQTQRKISGGMGAVHILRINVPHDH